ncbi:MAG: ABC transporter ATP-binding protein, partial [Steroidobacteraceae bacterium]
MATPASHARSRLKHAPPPLGGEPGVTLRGFFGVFRYSRRALELVWGTNRGLTIAFACLTIVAGVLPAYVAVVTGMIADAAEDAFRAGSHDMSRAIHYVILEGALVAAIAGAQRGLALCQSLLRAQLGQRVNEMILEKALTLSLAHFEDSEFYDKLTRARREASSRPLSLVTRTFGLMQNVISLVTFGALLVRFSPWAVAVLL